MDYQRIYREFITDRKARESSLIGYTECHHILPRRLGGTDDPSNLISLLPEDHFFAHLLLAKMHGGYMWAPVAFMVGGQRRYWKPCKSRRSYGWTMRAMAKARCKEGAYQFDHTIYVLEHKNGRQWSGTQWDMHEVLGMTRPLANLLVKRKVGSANGWFHQGERPTHIGRGSRQGQQHMMADHRRHRFQHIDGREFEGTQIEFRVHSGVSSAGCSGLVNGNRTISRGWHLVGVKPKTMGKAALKAQVNLCQSHRARSA